MSKTLKFQIAESYKKARTNLAYSIIKKGCKKIAFTSASQSEGKTSTSVNVAIAFAQQVDTKVLVVDCDLRRPAAHTILGVVPKQGLANYLNNECSLEAVITKTDTENLDFISYGVIPPNPSELLASQAMQDLVGELEKTYDYIIFDTPPVNMVIDVIPMVRLSDGVVIVAKHAQTTRPELNKAVDTLKRSEAKILGIIINQIPSVDTKKNGYYLTSK